MSLKVWLPLNGDLHNQGCSNVTVTNNGTTVNTNGKIGSCYEFGTNKYIKLIDYAAEFLTYNEFSLSVWFKCTAQNTSHTGSALISGGNWNQANNLLQFSLGNFSTDHYTKLFISGSGNWANGYLYNFYLNTWYNVVLTSGNGKMCAYVNGQLIGDTYNAFKPASLEQTWICIGNGTYTQVFHFIGLMNDIRIYDHCLSAEEIKEISQGLVLHYRLDTIGFLKGNENFILESHKVTSGSNAAGITRTYMDDGSIKIVADSGNNNYASIGFAKNSNNNVGEKLTVGDIYTISCDIKVETGTTLPTLFINSGNGYKKLQGSFTLNQWTRVYYTNIWAEPGTNYGNIALHLGFGGITGTYYFKNFKLEKGSSPTPWCPSPLDDCYASYLPTIIFDSSGYGHHGTITGNLSIVSNTPRYSFGMHLGKARINSSTGFPNGENPNFTIAFWTKIFSDITYVSYGDLCGMYDTGQGSNTFRLELCGSPASNNLMWFRGPSGRSGGGFNMNNASTAGWFTKDVWHHVALVGDGTNNKYYCYLDGIKCQTYNAGSNIWEPTGQFYIGDTVEATADFSDCRIYCTALLDADIKRLYETSMEIDSSGNILPRMLIT